MRRVPYHTRINVYYSTETIGTCTNHPRKGKTQLFRRNVNIEALEQNFKDTWVHTRAADMIERMIHTIGNMLQVKDTKKS